MIVTVHYVAAIPSHHESACSGCHQGTAGWGSYIPLQACRIDHSRKDTELGETLAWPSVAAINFSLEFLTDFSKQKS